jgi:hypothetical protein
MDVARRFKLVACEIMFREISACVSRSQNIIDVAFLPKGLHDIGQIKMSNRLQEEIDETDASRYEAILLGYGLCNNGICGVHASLPLAAPRAHDCITLLMGSRQKYSDYFQKNPGTYFYSPGWIERNTSQGLGEETIPTQLGINGTFEEYAAKYGEDNARYLMEVLGNWLKNYTKLAYIDTHTGDFERYKQQTQAEARERQWDYEEVDGSLDLLQRLVDGDWDAKDFLVIPPGRTIKPTYGDEVIQLTPSNDPALNDQGLRS